MSKLLGVSVGVVWLYLFVVLTVFVFTGIDLLEGWSKMRIFALAILPLIAAFLYGMLKSLYEQFIRWLSRQNR